MTLACLRQRTTTKSSLRSSCLAARLSAVAFASFVAVVLMASLPARADVYWSTSAGDWSVASYWGGALPTSSDNAWIVNGGTANITQLGQTCATLSLGSNAGSGAVQMTRGSFSTPGNQNVGYSGAGLFTQSGGSNSINNWFYLGYNTGSSGTYKLSGSGYVWALFECLGCSGTATFTQSGGTHTIANALDIGQFCGGTYTLSSGLLSALGESIGQFSTGTFLQSGGTHTLSSGFVLGEYAGSSGTYIFSGGQLSAASEEVGSSGTGAFTQSGGTNTVSQAFGLGYAPGSSGTYNLNGGLLVVPGFALGSGTATFNFSGGTLRAGSGFNNSLPMTLGTSGGGATLDTGGYTVTLSGSLSGPGSLTKVGSGTLILAATDTYSGNTLVRSGTLTLGSPLALQNSTLDTSGNGTLSFGSLTAATLGGLTGPGALGLSNSTSVAVALSVGNNNGSTTFSGMLKGPGSFNKIGSGALALAGSDTYSGSTTVTGGTLQIGNGGSREYLASPAIYNSGAVVFNHADALTYPGVISGSGSLTKLGSGVLALSGTNTYTGPTAVSQGKLTIDGWLTNSAVSVNGGTLGGTGYLGSVTVNAGGTLAPGDPLGVLHLSGNLVLAASGTMDFDLDGVSTDDEILMPLGSLTFSGQQFSNFGFAWRTGFGPGTYTLVNAKSISGLGSNLSGSIDGLPATLSVQNNDLMLTVVPEPSTTSLLGAGVVGLIGWAWRRRLAHNQGRGDSDLLS